MESRMRISKRASVFLAVLALMHSGLTLRAQQSRPDATVAPVPEKSKAVPTFTRRDRIRFYEETTMAAPAFAGPVLGAAVTEWVTDTPPEWGQGLPGYGRRVLGGFGRQAIANTVGLGVLLVDREDPRHYPTGRHGLWKRGLYAAREAVISRNATTGSLMPAYSRIVGDYTAGLVSNAWYPARSSNVPGALYRGSTALLSDVVWQEFKEFWPDVRRRVHFRR
jgi:hypothetical protein